MMLLEIATSTYGVEINHFLRLSDFCASALYVGCTPDVAHETAMSSGLTFILDAHL
jgi:hypothetical protein